LPEPSTRQTVHLDEITQLERPAMANSEPRASEPDRHDSSAIKAPTAARQGQKLGRVRYVLGFSVALAVIAMIIVFFVVR
jgi:hypothetical protein